MQTVFYYFCILFILVQLAMVVVPYLLRKQDLITSWSLFSLGAMCFVGLSGLSSVLTPRGYVENSTADYLWFFAGVIVFFASVNGVYFFAKWPSRLAQSCFRKWPPVSTSMVSFVIPMGIVMSLGLLFPVQVQGIGQLMATVGKNGIIIASVIALVYWYYQPYNPISIVIVVSVFLYSFGFSMVGGSGRRDMVAVLSVIPIVLYWCRYRYFKPMKTSAYILAVAIPAVLVLNAYSTLRHEAHRSGDKNIAALVQTAAKIPSRMLDPNGVSQMLGQNAVEVSLLSIHVYQTEKWSGFPTQPFHAAKFVLVNPIPRAFWSDKPEGLGKSLPRDTGLRGGRETWGPGIIGHGFHEGGLHMLLFYGVTVGVLLRLFDTLLYLYPGNPFLLSILAANAGQLIGWTRGDIGTFSIHIIAGVLAVWVVTRFARTFCGTQVMMPQPAQQHPQPA